MKNVNKGIFFQIGYGWMSEYDRPYSTNMFRFFCAVAVGLFLFWPLIIVTRIFGWLVRLVFSPVAIFFGYRPAGLDWRFSIDENRFFPFVPTKWYPTYERFFKRIFEDSTINFKDI